MRKRLPKEERRAQLIEIGRRLVEASSFEALSTDEVAAQAGISRSLLFHYFPTREHFLVAVAESASEDLLRLTDPDPGLPPLDRLRMGLEAYVDYVSSRRETYLALIRGQTGGGPPMQHIFEATRQALADRILDGLGQDPEVATAEVRLAARGYVALAEEVVVSWLRGDGAELSRDRLITVLEELGAAVVSAVGFPADQLGG